MTSPASPCPHCPASEARFAETGCAVVCVCGAVHAPEDFRWPEEPEPPEEPTRPDPALLARALEELALAKRSERMRRARVAGGPAEPRSSLGALQGLGSGAAVDATRRQVEGLSRLLLAPEGKVGKRARAGFVESLVRYCEDTSRPDDEVDWNRARVFELRLHALHGSEAYPVLRLLAERAGPETDWGTASSLVAYGLAPAPLLAATRVKAPGVPGRPRCDATKPPPEAALRAWGEQRLLAALRAWRDSPRLTREFPPETIPFVSGSGVP